MDLPKLHSITKKIFVALVGGFLLVFLLFHMTANLLILRHDSGDWYSAFCHFMGTNLLVKIMEIGLLGFIALHILLTMWLAVTNRLARPVRYHQRSRTKTHIGSKLMIWTGVLIFACIAIHFYDFYLVKTGLVKGQYMVKVEHFQDMELMEIWQDLGSNGTTSQMVLDEVKRDNLQTQDEKRAYDKIAVINILEKAELEKKYSDDHKWIRRLTYDDKQTLLKAFPDSDPEPDFYYQAREKFSHLHIVIGYLVFFFILFFHLHHAFPSAFQTLGLNNYKYNKAIEILGKIYTWIIVLGFACVPILVYLGL